MRHAARYDLEACDRTPEKVDKVGLLGLLLLLGFIGGLLAGLVGLGGGIILAPLLLYVPPMFGVDNLGMKEVARLTIIQSLCSTAAAGLAHHRARFVHAPLVRWMAPVIFIASLCGAILSERQFISPELLLGLFASVAFLSTLFIVAGKDTGQEDQDEVTNPDMSFSRQWAVAVASGVGFLGGMVGQSGAFMTIPLLVQVLRIPMRVAIGSSLAITFSAALAGSFGKLAGGGQVVWLQIGALATGSLMGSQLGTAFSCRLPVFYLRYGLAILIAIAAARMWYEVIT